jgi:ATP-dependent Clp protease ATP-binding subunit ClpA
LPESIFGGEMVELALSRQLHALGRLAIAEASLRRAGSVEAEHLLLAILGERSSRAASRLAALGLDYDLLKAALDAERERSLAAAGIAPMPAMLFTATPRTGTPGWGASLRNVLRQADKPAANNGGTDALGIELSIAILRAERGTVPRALALGGFDRQRLVNELRGNPES